VDSDKECIRNEAYPGNSTKFNPDHEIEEILSIQNLPGCVNYGFEGNSSTGSLRNRSEIGVQVDLEDY